MTVYSGLGGALSFVGANQAKVKNWTFTTTTNHPDGSCKANAYAVAVKGRTSGSFTAECLFDNDTADSPAPALITSAAVFAGTFSSGPTGAQKITCNVWINEYETESPDEDPVAIRVSGISDGTITFGTV